MKIVILADYSSEQFNKDFKLSNMLLERDHNVFLATSSEQFEFFLEGCDVGVIGYSGDKNLQVSISKKIFIVDKTSDIMETFSDILQNISDIDSI